MQLTPVAYRLDILTIRGCECDVSDIAPCAALKHRTLRVRHQDHRGDGRPTLQVPQLVQEELPMHLIAYDLVRALMIERNWKYLPISY